MPSPNLVYVASLNAQQVFNQLNQINVQINNTTNNANQGFSNLGSSIGVTAGVVGALTTEFIRLGQQAVGVLQEIISKSVETAIQVDTLKARLGGIFDGSKEAADQAFTFIQQKSKELGIDLSELAGAFIPKTENLAQFERVAKIATALARSDPEQGAIGARIALIEALSGTFTSLQRRFEIPKEDINRLKEAFDTQGMEGFVSELEKVLDEGGKSFEDLADTAQTTFSKLGIAGQQLGGRLGAPIVESLEEASNKILSFLSENEDDLIVFADTIGRAIADAISFISSIDLGELDTAGLIEVGDYIFRIVESAKLAIGQFLIMRDATSQLSGGLDPLTKTLEFLYWVFSNIDDAMVTASQIFALLKAGSEAATVAIQPLIDYYQLLFETIEKGLSGDFAGAAESLAKAAEVASKQFDTEGAQKAFNQSILESQKAFDAYNQALDENKTKQDDLRKTLEEQKTAGTGAADAIMQKARADKQAAEDAEKLKEAQDKVNEAMADAQKDFQRKLEDIDIQTERKRLDIQIEFAQKREDAARDNLRKLEDIRRKNAQDLQDASTDLEREEQDISRKFADERLDLEKEQRQKRVDIETSYRQKLQDIRSEDSLDLEEVERKRDAVAFLKILRQQQQKVNQAQVDRSRELDELKLTGEQRKEELRIQQQRELEEAQLTNQRKLEDLQLNLERQIEAQNTAYAQQLDDLRIGEERKVEELNKQRERDIEDAKKAYDRKLEDLKESLAEELAILKEGNAALEEEQKRHNSVMQSSSKTPVSQQSTFVQNKMSLDKKLDATKDRQYSSGRTVVLGGRASGGPVFAGGTYPVGEKGPELFTPNTNGFITPTKDLLMSLPSSSPVSNYTNSRKQEINIPMVNGSQLLDSVFIAKLRNIISEELGGLLG